MLQVGRSLSKADRAGSWMMHFQSRKECLPIFAADVCMHHFQHTPDVHTAFSKEFHVICHSNHFLENFGSDQVIDHTLIRALNSSGGLNHGSGMNGEMDAL